MKFIFSFSFFTCSCLLYVVADDGIMEYDTPKDAFKSQYSQLPISHQNHTSIVMCKLLLAARYRSKIVSYNLEDIPSGISFDGNLCTHIIYQRLIITSQLGTIIRDDEYLFMKKFNNLIQVKYPHLKSLVEIKLSEVKSYKEALLNLTSTRDKQLKMMSMILEMVRELNVSGAYFDTTVYITYPDKIFIDFAKILKKEFQNHDLILAAEIYGYSTMAFDQFFSHVTQICRIFDIVVLLGWGYDSLYEGRPAHISPLFASALSEKGHIDNVLLHLISQLNVRLSTLVLGVTFIGKPFLLKPRNADATTDTMSRQESIKGPIHGYTNLWFYYEICHSALANNESWRIFWDEKAKVPFMEDEKRWISFDNADSIYEKAVYANNLGLLGVLIDATEADDFNGICTETKYPLLKAVNMAFAKNKDFRGSLLCSEFKKFTKNINVNLLSNTRQSDLVTLNPYYQSAVAKSNVKITCTVEGTGRIQNITWIVDEKGEEVPIKSRRSNIVINEPIFKHNQCLLYNTTISTLEIGKMEAKNSGKYICKVETRYESVKEESYLYCKNCRAIQNGGTSSLDWVWIGVAAIIAGLTVAIAMGFVQWHLGRKNRNGLSSMEIVFFNNGLQQKHKYKDTSDGCANPDELQYDQDTFEIFDNAYEIDRGSILGSGQFGIVYKGRIQDKLVAVKTTKPGCDKLYLKSLLQELKVLIHIGKHPNIVSVLGAKTKRLSQGVAYIFVEYCALGSLNEFLRKCRNNFVKTDTSSGDNEGIHRNYTNCLTTHQLAKWSYQMINALQHLRRSKVIHGDLAARNILLFDIDTIKVNDFGLSRKQYNYSNYIKKSQEPLPWRWMAVEALRDMTFSFQSDIWSFGITIWEIFSLAETPYPGISFSYDFIKELENGHRMDSPKHATPQIYDLMKKCWRLNPEERPKIDEIEQEFLPIINKRDPTALRTHLDGLLISFTQRRSSLYLNLEENETSTTTTTF